MTHSEKQNRETLPIANHEHQLVLPLDLGISRQVTWYHAEEVTERKWWRTRKIIRFIGHNMGLPAKTSIDAGSIAELKDPALRYALAFADAADAVGWTVMKSGSGMFAHNVAHGVTVVATDEGNESRLLRAQYTGIGKGDNDSFMQNLHNAAPSQNDMAGASTGTF